MASFHTLKNRRWPRVFVALVVFSTLAPLELGLFLASTLAARGAGEAEQKLAEDSDNAARQRAVAVLQEVEELAKRYPKLRVFVSLQRSKNTNAGPTAAQNFRFADSAAAASAIWSEPSLYEAFLWLANFAFVSTLGESDLQALTQSLMQILQSIGDFRKSPERELGRLFIKNYFRRRADSRYPGQDSWLIFRFFLDPISSADSGVRRLSILYNAYRENLTEVTLSRVTPLRQGPMHRSSAYPQKSSSRLSYQYAYLIPKPLSQQAITEEAVSAVAKFDVLENQAKEKKNNVLEQVNGQLGQKQEPALVAEYRLSFIPRKQLYSAQKLHPQYSTSKYLEILRNYLRDVDSGNDSQVPPAVQVLSRRKLNPENYFLMQEIIFYYYLLYLPDRCNYFISSQQSHRQLNSATAQIKNLWRLQIPRIWSAIDAVRLRYSRELENLLPG